MSNINNNHLSTYILQDELDQQHYIQYDATIQAFRNHTDNYPKIICKACGLQATQQENAPAEASVSSHVMCKDKSPHTTQSMDIHHPTINPSTLSNNKYYKHWI